MDEVSLPDMLFGYMPAQMLYATAELGLADALADGPRTAVEVAKQTGTDPSGVRRLLRALVGIGLVVQVDGELFRLTGLGEQLRADVPGSLRDQVLLSTMPELWRAWGQLAHSVRTGEPARHPGTGLTPQESMLRDSELAGKYRAAMADSNRHIAPLVAAAYDFSRYGTVADIGGDGTLIAAVLVSQPNLRGVLQSKRENLEQATETVGAAGVGDRCEIVVGDYVKSVPPGADAYVLNNVIRDWDDDAAASILRTCRTAMSADARLVLVETVMPAVITADDPASYGMTDLNMLVYAGGKERTEDELGDLLAAAGFALTTVTDMAATSGVPGYQAIEGKPSADPYRV